MERCLSIFAISLHRIRFIAFNSLKKIHRSTGAAPSYPPKLSVATQVRDRGR
jgi:hypothetical protein